MNMVEATTPVIILVFNGWEDAFKAVAASLAQTSDVWVVDNGSTVDRTGEMRARFPGLRTIRHEQNYGFAGGYNRAIAVAQAENIRAVYLLNSDAVPEPGAIQSAFHTLAIYPDAAAVASLIVKSDRKSVTFDGQFYEDVGERHLTDVTLGLREVSRLHGSGFAISLLAYYDIGPMDDRFFLYHEEAEWSVRVIKRGYKIILDTDSMIVHEGCGSSSQENREYYCVRNLFLAEMLGNPIDGAWQTRGYLVRQELKGLPGKPGHVRQAAADGLLDGVRGRWGKRGASRTALMRQLQLAALHVTNIPYRLQRLIKVLAGQAAS